MNDDGDGAAELRWAPRVAPAAIRRLYEGDAQGRLDEELLDEVFFGFLARCRSIVTVTDAAMGQVTCPRCREILPRRVGVGEKDEVLRCACGWTTTWGRYFATYQGRQLVGGTAIDVFREFLRRAPRAESARERMLLVDWIVHEAHKSVLEGEMAFFRPTAVNLIEGRIGNVVRFLDELAYGPGSTAGRGDHAEQWRTRVRPQLARWLRADPRGAAAPDVRDAAPGPA
jgi:hypothetical protein